MITHIRMSVKITGLLMLMVPGLATAALETQKVTDDVYALVGPLGQRSPENLGNNATFGVVVTKAGVVLIDSGGTRKGAEEIEHTIRKITDKPVVLVINSGGQDHRWLGNDYFKKKGAKVIASAAAVKDHKTRLNNQLLALERFVGDNVLEGTVDSYADQVFDKMHDITVGGVEFKLRHYGQAHTPGDSFIWLPQKKVMFTGDIVYVERMLGVGSMSKSSTWVKVFEEIEKLKPKHIVPGHGHATTLAKARADTYDYLVMLRSMVGRFLEKGGGAEDISKLNQSRFKYLKVYDQLKGPNALNVYIEMEFE